MTTERKSPQEPGGRYPGGCSEQLVSQPYRTAGVSSLNHGEAIGSTTILQTAAFKATRRKAPPQRDLSPIRPAAAGPPTRASGRVGSGQVGTPSNEHPSLSTAVGPSGSAPAPWWYPRSRARGPAPPDGNRPRHPRRPDTPRPVLSTTGPHSAHHANPRPRDLLLPPRPRTPTAVRALGVSGEMRRGTQKRGMIIAREGEGPLTCSLEFSTPWALTCGRAPQRRGRSIASQVRGWVELSRVGEAQREAPPKAPLPVGTARTLHERAVPIPFADSNRLGNEERPWGKFGIRIIHGRRAIGRCLTRPSCRA